MPDNEELLKRIHQSYRDATSHLNNRVGNMKSWLEETDTVFRFAAGDQWSYDDYWAMLNSRRAPLSFNKIDPYIDAAVGVAINNAQEIKFFPRGERPDGYSEFLTGIFEYISDKAEFEDEEIEAFRDMLLCGMGWTDTRPDYKDNLDGDILKMRIDPLRMRWDPTSSRKNLKDSQWRLAIKDMSLEELESKYDITQSNYANPWDSEIDLIGYGNRIIETSEDYGRNSRSRSEPRRTEHVGFYQYKVPKTVYRVATPEGIQELEEEEYSKVSYEIRQRGWRAIKQQRWQVRQAIVLGDKVLDDDIGPASERFTFEPMTGKYDRIGGVWYGLVRPLVDAQLWTNKFFSTLLYTVSASPKGGLIAEISAFSDIRAAERKWNKTDSIIVTNDGAIENRRIMPKPQTPYPNGIERLLEITQTAIKESAGISPEMMGMSENIQPGVVESQRKQASLAILAWAFNSLRSYRKANAHLVMSLARNYIADGRLVRISGPKGQQYVPLLEDQLSLDYDVVADESPSSPSVKERTWLVLIELLPYAVQAGIQVPPEVFDYVPIPESLKEAWKRILNPEPTPEAIQAQQRQQQIAERAQQAEIADKEASAAQKQSTAALNQAKIQEIAQKYNISEEAVMKLAQDAQLKLAEIDSKERIAMNRGTIQ